MAELKTAAARLEDFREAVAWLKSVAGTSNSRIPPNVGSARSKMGEMGTGLVSHFLPVIPTTAVWRLGIIPAGATDERVVVPAHLLIKNMRSCCMYDDIITVNCFILQRWCVSTGARVQIVQCSLFERHVQCAPDAVGTTAEELHRLSRSATKLTGVCNISGAHWVGFVVDLQSCDCDALRMEMLVAVVRDGQAPACYYPVSVPPSATGTTADSVSPTA